MPGLINTHTHAPMVLYRGLADDLALMDWLQKYIFPAEAKTVSPAFVRAGTRLAALEMIRSGTTTYADMYYFEEEIARVTKAAGLRGVLGQTIIKFPVAGREDARRRLSRTERFIKEFASDDLIVPAVAPHAMYTLEAATLKSARQLADRERVPVILHLAETQDEVKIAAEQHKATPVGYLESLGFFGPQTLAAHAVHLTTQDIEILRKRGVGVSHNPESNMKLASGTAPVPALRRAGSCRSASAPTAPPATTTSTCSSRCARRPSCTSSSRATRAPCRRQTSSRWRPARARGARNGADHRVARTGQAGRPDRRVDERREADPDVRSLSHLVYVTRGDDVQTTIVNGKILMRDGKVLTLNEAGRARRRPASSQADVRQAVAK